MDPSSSPAHDGPQRVRLPLLRSEPPRPPARAESSTAVDRFARQHDSRSLALGASEYRDLVPLERPRPGEQYAFHVDLDRCSGCKACVTACHSLNGLDEGEIWRSVGVLHGGTSDEPVQQIVTTACHHCVDPACLAGCPVQAYEKDPATGIVRHLDDQCIGCQYCLLTCPYDVPKYNPKRGIVRKCDLCADRLAADEAPACVDACPTEAIAIRVVETKRLVEDAQADAFLPGAPSPGITIPTTTYATRRPMPKNLLPVDFHVVRAGHRHLPLVGMLVLTQLSVGAFACDLLVSRLSGIGEHRVHALIALLVAVIALGASLLHLGRPLYAFRAVLGLRTSWLSREILAFGAFTALALAHAGCLCRAELTHVPLLGRVAVLLPVDASSWLGPLVAASGALGVACSVMVYEATRRRFWSGPSTAAKFFLTALLLGSATTLATAALGDTAAHGVVRSLAFTVAILTASKLGFELLIFRHLRDRRHGELKRTALLLIGDLAGLTKLRFATAGAGGLVLALVIAAAAGAALLRPDAPSVVVIRPLALVALVLVTLGEFFERTTFFAAESGPRMPGGLP